MRIYICVKDFKGLRHVADFCPSPQSVGHQEKRLFLMRKFMQSIMVRLVCEFNQFPQSAALMSINVNTASTNK